ncbi:MAG: hypothetical protein KDE33_08700 [Bacteroidetes bacterium]|nr:hypothetical protein [Bacteroidota bacterium]MCB9227438.1 hypothetical protein [Chitinophagales bacterium]
MIVFSKKTERFINYVSSQFDKHYSTSKNYMPIKGLVKAKLYFEEPNEGNVKFVIDKDELPEDKIAPEIYELLPEKMYYTK